MVIHPVMTRLSENVFSLAKEISIKLTQTFWTLEERQEGRLIHVSMNIDDSRELFEYFKAIGFHVKFLPNQDENCVTQARFFPIIDDRDYQDN